MARGDVIVVGQGTTDDIGRVGFVNQTETGLFFNDTNAPVTNDGTSVPAYSFQLYATGTSWSYYLDGVKRTITGNKTVPLGSPPTKNRYYITITNNITGDLTAGTGVWDLLDETVLPVAIVNYDPSATPKYWLADERHSVLIDRREHYRVHYTQGTKLISGFGLTNVEFGISSPTNANNTFGIAETKTLDEDILLTQTALTEPDGTNTDYVVFYRTAGVWYWKLSNAPYIYNVGNANGLIQRDNGTDMVDVVGNNNYINTYLIATNYVTDSQAARFIVVAGPTEYNSLSAAQAEDVSLLNLTGIGIAEYVIGWRLTWKYTSSFTTSGKARLEVTPKMVNISAATIAAAGGALHNTLSGLQGGTANEYYHLTSAEHDATIFNYDNTVNLIKGSFSSEGYILTGNSPAPNFSYSNIFTWDIANTATGLSNPTNNAIGTWIIIGHNTGTVTLPLTFDTAYKLVSDNSSGTSGDYNIFTMISDGTNVFVYIDSVT